MKYYSATLLILLFLHKAIALSKTRALHMHVPSHSHASAHPIWSSPLWSYLVCIRLLHLGFLLFTKVIFLSIVRLFLVTDTIRPKLVSCLRKFDDYPMPSILRISAVVTAMHRSMFHALLAHICRSSDNPSTIANQTALIGSTLVIAKSCVVLSCTHVSQTRHLPSIPINCALSQHCSSLYCTVHAVSKHLGLKSTCRKS